ncbi:MAG: hypothetical protein JJE46_09930 [Acidimicrobiia bacterium]|nr:hypothetical protein [Acidimicrobiia bacterium]
MFKFTADAPDHATARAGTDNVSGNTRVVFTHPADPATTDSQTCGTWSSDAGSFDQEGAALRVHTVDGGVKAITVTKNVVFGAKWIFNLHVWDTSRLPVPDRRVRPEPRLLPEPDPAPPALEHVCADRGLHRELCRVAVEPGTPGMERRRVRGQRHAPERVWRSRRVRLVRRPPEGE